MGKLQFVPGLPRWVHTQVRAEVKRLRLTDWTILVQPAEQDDLREWTGTKAPRICLGSLDAVPSSKMATLCIWNEIEPHISIRDFVRHEFLHAILAPIRVTIEQGFAAKPRMNEFHINRLALDAEEQVIAHLIEVLNDGGK